MLLFFLFNICVGSNRCQTNSNWCMKSALAFRFYLGSMRTCIMLYTNTFFPEARICGLQWKQEKVFGCFWFWLIVTLLANRKRHASVICLGFSLKFQQTSVLSLLVLVSALIRCTSSAHARTELPFPLHIAMTSKKHPPLKIEARFPRYSQRPLLLLGWVLEKPLGPGPWARP